MCCAGPHDAGVVPRFAGDVAERAGRGARSGNAERVTLALPEPTAGGKATAEAFDPWTGRRVALSMRGRRVGVAGFSRSLVVRLTAANAP
jgi:hypothetical protein